MLKFGIDVATRKVEDDRILRICPENTINPGLQDKIGTEIVGIDGVSISGKEALVVLDRVLRTSDSVRLLLKGDNGIVETVDLMPLSWRMRLGSILRTLPKDRMPQTPISLDSPHIKRGLRFNKKGGKFQVTAGISNEGLRKIFHI